MTNIWVIKILVQTDQEMGQIQSKRFPSEEVNKDFSFSFTYLFDCSQSSSITCSVLTGTSLVLLWSESSSEDGYLRDCLEWGKLDPSPGSIECCSCYLLVQKTDHVWLNYTPIWNRCWLRFAILAEGQCIKRVRKKYKNHCRERQQNLRTKLSLKITCSLRTFFFKKNIYPHFFSFKLTGSSGSFIKGNRMFFSVKKIQWSNISLL